MSNLLRLWQAEQEGEMENYMVVKFKDGVCCELYEYYDQMALLTQLGLT